MTILLILSTALLGVVAAQVAISVVRVSIESTKPANEALKQYECRKHGGVK